ncbi:MAG: flippase-like domain-containing protein [Phycisphaeraceae bacterium]|nr:flippase-like domain-containing protein [Phycisphaeraceae bacterium]
MEPTNVYGGTPRGGRATRAIVGSIVGGALLVAAVWTASLQGGSLADGLRAMRSAEWWLVAMAIVLPIANLFVVSVAFWLLNNRHGSVRLDEMAGLIASAWLLNYLPLRPGMFGRIAYHKKYNGIGIKASARVLAETVAMAGIAMAMLASIVLGLDWIGVEGGPVWWAVASAPLVGGIAVWRGSSDRTVRAYAGAMAMKYADVALWAFRYWAVFALIGREIGAREAVAVAVVSQVALLIPLAGNGLGLREWAVGLLAAALPGWYAMGEDSGAGIGLTADLVNRAAEVMVAIPLGVLGIVGIARLVRGRSVRVRASEGAGSK